MQQAVIVCVCGLPGAGKTSLLQSLVGTGHDELVGSRWGSRHGGLRLEHVCFDELFNELSSTVDAFDPRAWKDAQGRMAALVQRRLAEHATSESEEVLVLLVDDNFQYRSLRKRFFHLAQDAMCGFGVLYVDTAPEICRARNQRRSGHERVPEEAFDRMLVAFEPPNAPGQPFEFNTAVVTIGSCQVPDEAADTRAVGETLGALVMEAMRVAQQHQHELELMKRKLQQQHLDQQRTLGNAVNQIDQALRRWISAVVRGEETTIQVRGKAQRGHLAQFLNERRKSCLAQLKTQSITPNETAGVIRNFKIVSIEEYLTVGADEDALKEQRNT